MVALAVGGQECGHGQAPRDVALVARVRAPVEVRVEGDVILRKTQALQNVLGPTKADRTALDWILA
eukprot:5609041-Alexandrium_andersonii.AAC.1